MLQYLTEVNEYIGDITVAVENLTLLLGDPLLNNETWLKEVGYSADVIQRAHENLSAMDVPPEMKEAHRAILYATQDFYDAMDYTINGVTYLDVGDIQKASGLLMSGNRNLDRATELVLELE